MNRCEAECAKYPDEGDDKGLVLLVDDNEVNRQLYEESLLAKGYRVISAEDGIEGLDKAIAHVPDVILLDVMMPGMDGFKVCGKLKALSETSDIPVIFITAKVETGDIIKGLKLGGVDYLTKPVRVAELIARVNTQMRIRMLERGRLAAEKNRMEAAHWEAVKAMSEGIAHNFNNILAAVFGNLQFINKELNDPSLREAAADCLDSLEKAKQLVRLLLIYFDLRPDLNPVKVAQLIKDEIALLSQEPGPGIKIETDLHDPMPDLAPGGRPYVQHALRAVLKNAVEAVKKGSGTITVRAFAKSNGRGDDRLIIEVLDPGAGLSEDTRAKAFLPFFSTKNTVGVGLGLYAAKMALAQIKGEIELDNRPEGGAVARISLPLSGETGQ